MSPSAHALSSLFAGGLLFAATGDMAAASSCFAAGILIDLDHLLEYIWYVGLPWNPKDFVEACRETRYPKTFLFFHSWELLAILWIYLFASFQVGAPLGCAVGLTLHLLLDQLGNDTFAPTYLLGYRIAVSFDAARLFRKVARRKRQPSG